MPVTIPAAAEPLNFMETFGKLASSVVLARQSANTSARPPFGAELMGFGWNQATSPDSNWLAAAIRPYVLAAIDAFSPSRCMFASNFPGDAASYGYGILWNAFKRVAACYSFDEQRELSHDTAARVYRLPG